MSAVRAARVGDHGKHGLLLEGRDGAGNESARSPSVVPEATAEEELVASSESAAVAFVTTT